MDFSALTDVMETEKLNIPVAGVDITDVENSVENVEKPLSSRKTPVENPVEEVDKKLHKGCQT